MYIYIKLKFCKVEISCFIQVNVKDEKAEISRIKSMPKKRKLASRWMFD